MSHATSRRALMLGCASVSLLMAAGVRHASALVIVEDIEAELNTLNSYYQEVATKLAMLQQVQTSVSMLTNMVRQGVTLPQQLMGTLTGDLSSLRNITNSASLMSGGTGDIIGRLGSAGYQLGSLADIPGRLDQQRLAVQNSLSALGKTLGLQDTQTASDAAIATGAMQHSSSAAGTNQILQSANELANANQMALQEIQKSLQASIQQSATWQAAQTDRQAIGDTVNAQVLSGAAPNENQGGSIGWFR